MTPLTRMFLIALLVLPMVGGLAAQEATTTVTTTTTAAPEATGTADEPAAAPAERLNDWEVRNEFSTLLRNSSSELVRILVLQPNLLSNAEFMAEYPDVARYVAEHPEIARRPRFFLGDFGEERPRGPLEQIAERASEVMIFLFFAVAVSWLIRTILDHRRWNRLSRTQSEVHNKILDRFGTSAELMEYVKTPAGSKFLESAPIPLHAEKGAQFGPQSRVLLSIQAGVIVVAGALGMLLVSTRYTDSSGEGLFALGAIALCVGLGFIGSAVVTMLLSRRLGLWQGGPRPDESEEPGLVR